MNKPIITRNTDFSLTVQITTEPYSEGLLILSSTNANPLVITTELPHQLLTNDRIRISGHRKNTIANGKHTVTVIDALNFSIPVAGAIVGDNSGRVSKATNITGFVLSAKTKLQHGGSAVTGADPTVTTTGATDGEISIVLSKTQTALVLPKSCIIEVTYIDTDNLTHIFSIECEVKNA